MTEDLRRRLAGSVQTLSAELLDLLIRREAEAALVATPGGSFVSKTIRGRSYWYVQRVDGGQRKQLYLGAESPELMAWIHEVRALRDRLAPDEDRIRDIATMIRAGGAPVVPPRPFTVLQVLASAGLFRYGGVLVGTHAFALYGLMLGIHLEHAALRTEDVDIAHRPGLAVALAADAPRPNLPKVLQDAGLGLLPVPGLDPREPSTSFKVRGAQLRVDFLAPLVGRESSKPVILPGFGQAAEPVRHLEYLLENAQPAAAVGRTAVLVSVPDPARFALHKLLVATKRPPAFHAKAAKDRRQAAALLTVLATERPMDISRASNALATIPTASDVVRAEISRLELPELEGLI
jgi:hypothetical protein